uniref:Golgi vesicular membrane trafficking protein p1 n=1 Tax=Rhipicephalus zambeziensis TaxID=60191 RepID=A0A224YY94_9ACAR
MEEERLETENQRLADQLSNQVSHLKSLAYDIELETKKHNRLLGGLGWDFDGSQGILSGSMGPVSTRCSSPTSPTAGSCAT